MVYRTAFRYVFSKSNGNRKAGIFIILGICISLAALLVTMSVMTGLQSMQTDVIREIKSFDMQLFSSHLTPDELLKIKGVKKAFYFKDADVLFYNRKSQKSVTGKLRIIDTTEVYEDSENIYFYGNGNGLCLSSGMMIGFKIAPGDDLDITFLKKGKTNLPVPYNKTFKVANVYNCRLNDFNNQVAFISEKEVSDSVSDNDYKIGLYIDGNIREIKKQILLIDPKAEVSDWMGMNSSLYSALVLEKRVVLCFLLLICIIVCLNLKSSTYRLVEIKKKDAAILRILGLSSLKISFIFILYGIILLLAGEFLGIFLSHVLIDNIGSVFRLIDRISSVFGHFANLSSMAFNLSFSYSDCINISMTVAVIGLIFIVFGCRKTFFNDVSEVILNASH